MGFEKQRIGVGILGCADIARRRFLPALRNVKNAELIAVASRDAVKARNSSPWKDYAVMGYDELLSNDRVHLVYIPLPNHLHEAWVMRALEQGKHVICEKPLALSAESAERMIGYAEKKNLLLYENIMYLHHPQHLAVKDMVAQGEIGRIRLLRAAFGFMLPAQDNFRLHADQGGGSFRDQASYPLSAALFYLQGKTYRFSGSAHFRGDLNVGMQVSAITDQEEGLMFSLGFEQYYECWYEIVGEKGAVRIDRAFTTPADLSNAIIVTRGSETRSVLVPAADHFQRMIDRICSVLLQGQDFHTMYRDARRLSLLTGQVWESCEQVQL